jgi:hypothetical protein
VDAVDGFGSDGALRVRVRAAPVDGAANAALLRLLADRIDVARGAVRLVSGSSGRRKLIEVSGMIAGDVVARLAPVQTRGAAAVSDTRADEASGEKPRTTRPGR